jgi:hypothetical protein
MTPACELVAAAASDQGDQDMVTLIGNGAVPRPVRPNDER